MKIRHRSSISKACDHFIFSLYCNQSLHTSPFQGEKQALFLQGDPILDLIRLHSGLSTSPTELYLASIE